jgi:hypothetical protein
MAYAKMLNDRDMVVERENAAGDRMERILQSREAMATARTEKATTAYNTAYEAVSKRGVDTSTAKGRLAFADELSKLDPTAGAAMREDANKMKREEVRENRYAARAAGVESAAKTAANLERNMQRDISNIAGGVGKIKVNDVEFSLTPAIGGVYEDIYSRAVDSGLDVEAARKRARDRTAQVVSTYLSKGSSGSFGDNPVAGFQQFYNNVQQAEQKKLDKSQGGERYPVGTKSEDQIKAEWEQRQKAGRKVSDIPTPTVGLPTITAPSLFGGVPDNVNAINFTPRAAQSR